MSLVNNLIGFGLRQAIGAVAGDETGEAAGKAAGKVIQVVVQHFTDHSQTLPKALARANDRAWQSLSIALAGDTFLDQIKVFFASGDDKGIREQVRLFLLDKNIGYEGTPAVFRKKCLAELKQAKKAGLLTAQNLSPNDVARQAANFQRYANPKDMIDGAEQVIGQIAADLASEYPNLAHLLRQRPSAGPPLLVSAFAYFFRRQIETDDELAHGLFFDGLRQLSASQAKAFGEINKALISLGDQFEQVFQQLDRIETVVAETQKMAVATHGAVLDMQMELQRLGNNVADEVVRRLEQDALKRLDRAGMHGEVKPEHSCSIRSPEEREAVKQLLAQFRHLPSNQQKQLPALLNGLGKLQQGIGDLDGARESFVAVAESVSDKIAKAEAYYNAYRVALEKKNWDEALVAIQKAASLAPQRFAPFPMQRYQPKKILGAGGFGTAFLCHDRFFNADVVVKTLHDTAMERSMTEVFREAQVLRELQHPAIIGVRDCNYADLTEMARPYIVMDYFPGGSLENFIHQRGTISPGDMIVVARQVSEGMQAAHQQHILHRDLKPDNILVRKEGSNWKVKIIDFGLALRRQVIENSTAKAAAGDTPLINSAVGTVKYAPPEQMDSSSKVPSGTYSDVYSFGKMCCYALFKTTEPKDRHWKAVPESIRTDLKEMLDQCREEELQHRFSSFEPVLKVLEALGAAQRQPKEPEADAEIDLTVPGCWYTCPENKPTAVWDYVGKTPGKLSLRPSKAYKLEVNVNTTDEQLAGLANLQGFTALQSLDLSKFRQLTDAGLAHLRGLTGLQSLNLGFCDKVTDAGLAYLKGLTDLKSLNLSGCKQITDAGLAHLRGLTGLQSLNLFSCDKVTDAGLAHLRGLTALQSLNLFSCYKVTDAGLAHLRGLTALQSLNLWSCNQITDAGLAHLKGLTALQSLNLSGYKQITDAGLAYLKGLTTLQSLDLQYCGKVTDAGLAYLKGLTALQSLDLQYCDKVTDAGLAHLQGLTALQLLSLWGCKQITDAGLAYLKGLTALQSLDLLGCEQLTDAGLAHLQGLTALKSLDLVKCKQITDTGLAYLRRLIALQSLNLGGCDKVTDAGLAHLQGLTALTLSGCNQITDAGLAYLKGLTALQSLNLGGCDKVTDAGLAHLQGLTALQSLTLAQCKQITDTGLAYLRRLIALQSLNLSGCNQITDAGLAHLRRLIALKSLYLYDCEQLTDAGLAHLQGLTALQLLKVGGCKRVTNACRDSLREALPQCDIS